MGDIDQPLAGPCVDEALLSELRSVIGDALDDIVRTYLTDTPRLLGELDGALAAGDVGAVRAIAHQLKSSSASLGALRLSSLMKQMEQIGANGSTEGVAPLLAAAHRDFAEVANYFSEQLAA